jgi:RimJ/RimL family protein N-acetyltransferase
MAQPVPHLAPEPGYRIYHYPATLIDTRVAGNTGRLTLRPVLPQDHLLLADLVAGLSPSARRNRFHGAVNLSFSRLQQMSCVDYQRQMALVVTACVDGAERLIADARYVVESDQKGAEFALMVDERWQRHGIGAWALRALERAATLAGLQRLHGAVLEDNAPMLGLMRRCTYTLSSDLEDNRLVRAQRRLDQAMPEPARTRRGLLSWLTMGLRGGAPAAAR